MELLLMMIGTFTFTCAISYIAAVITLDKGNDR